MFGLETAPSYQALKLDVETTASGIDRVADQLKRVSAKGTKDDLARAAVEFESFFIFFVLKAMRATIDRSDVFGDNRSTDMYQSILDEKLAKQIAKAGGLGLSRALLNQISTKGPEPEQLSGRLGAPGRRPNSTGHKAHTLGGVVSSRFGYRNDPFTGEWRFHGGVDVAMAEGSQIRAVKSGWVTFSGRKKGSGNMVVVKSEDGYAVSYAHNKENLVSEGQYVGKGQPLALVGSTGRSTGPHLHLEVKKDGERVDPSRIINLRT